MTNKTTKEVAVIGCGTIGASWAALMLSHGVNVSAFDPNAAAEESFRRKVSIMMDQLDSIGLSGNGVVDFYTSLEKAVARVEFVQECTPEDPTLKVELFKTLEDLLPSAAIVASSTSSLMLSDITMGCHDRSRFIIAHPFNPPHLIPLVEVFGTVPEIVDQACEFYRQLGRRPVRLNKEMPGHIANRLSSALYREAVYLVDQDIASVEDIDAAVVNGPGMRWAAVGPHLAYHLGGGDGGISNYFEHLGASQERRWETLGTPSLTDSVKRKIIKGVDEAVGSRSILDLESERDRILLTLLKANL